MSGLFTFNFEVVSSKTVGFKVEGQRCVGLIEEQVDPGQLDAVPLKHRTQHLSGNKEKSSYIIHQAGNQRFVWLPLTPLTSVFSFSLQEQFLC